MRITQSKDVTPELLTELLTASDVLRAGAVTEVVCEMESSHKGFISNVATFQLTYSEGAQGNVPHRLFLKLTKPDLHPEYGAVGEHEIKFYTDILPAGPPLPVARCYYAEWEATAGRAAFLLDDFSQSHFHRPLPLPPVPNHCYRIVESLARVHAYWWNHPQLGKTIGTPLSPADADASLKRLEATFPKYLDYLGDALLPAQRLAYERIFASAFLPRRAERLITQNTVTLIHGDAHTNNLLLPHDDQRGQVVLIDWHRWGIDVPLYDLAFLIALHWSAERRAALEQPLLRHYHAHLLQQGVTDYSWEECWRDYGENVIVVTLIPIGQFRRQMPAGVIWYGMENSVAAFNDLACVELL